MFLLHGFVLDIQVSLFLSFFLHASKFDFRALLEIVRALGPLFSSFITTELLALILVSLEHINRFVRETSYYVCEKLTDVVHSNPTAVTILVSEFDFKMAAQLSIGLSDNWSQVWE